MTTSVTRKTSWQQRFDRWLWDRESDTLSGWQRLLLRQLQTLVMVFQDFNRNQSMLSAAALTYYTMLSLVPLLALIFALLKAFGVQNLLQPMIMDKLKVGEGHVADAILSYINNTQVAQLGAFGLIFLLIAVITLLTNVEKAFNHVWGVKDIRPLVRRFADYLSVILVGPVLVIGAMSMTSGLASNRLVQTLIEMQLVGNLILLLFKVAPFVFMWLAFTGLYLFMSNIKVEWRAALIGGVVGGTLWQFAQVGYVYFQVGVGRYNAIYGTMAALPIFMVWLYLSWVIVLFGLGVCYAKQTLRTGGRDLRVSEVSTQCFEQLALALLVTLAQRFAHGAAPLSYQQLANQLKIPPRLCRDILDDLLSLGLVAELRSSKGRHSYQLGRSAEDLSVATIYQQLRNQGREALYLNSRPQTQIAQKINERIAALTASGLADQTLKDLVLSCEEQTADEPVNDEDASQPA